MSRQKLRIRHFGYCLLLCLDSLYFSTINPRTVNALGLVGGLVLLLVSLYAATLIGCRIIGVYVPAIGKRRSALATLLTAELGVSIGLQSVGQFAPRDLLVMVPIGIVVYIYYATAVRRLTKGHAGLR